MGSRYLRVIGERKEAVIASGSMRLLPSIPRTESW
jgi:hypothetical protein